MNHTTIEAAFQDWWIDSYRIPPAPHAVMTHAAFVGHFLQLTTAMTTLTEIEWLTSSEFAKRYRVSQNRLKDLRDQQVFVAGVHYLMFGSHRLYDAAACDKAVREHSRARAQVLDGTP